MGLTYNKPENEVILNSNADCKLRGILKQVSIWSYLKPKKVSFLLN